MNHTEFAFSISAVATHYLIVSMAFLTALLLIYALKIRLKYQNAQKLLFSSKREAEGIAQLAMTNPHPLIQIDQNGQVKFVNPAALEIFPGILRAGLNHPALRGIRPDTGSAQNLERDVILNNKIYHQSYFRSAQDGALIIHCVDITNLKKAEKALQASIVNAEKSRQVAVQAKEARGEFLANMSHELRTPMNGIIGLSGLLMEHESEPDKRQLAEGIYYSATSLLGLLNDILDFSKIEAGELTLEHIVFSPVQILKEIELLHQSTAQSKGIAFKMCVDESLPNALKGDPARLCQILNNLVSNALKFTAQGHVKISASGHQKTADIFSLTLQVEDTGIGIDKNKQAVIFEKFRQADPSTARLYGGTGLGLAITKRISDLMGGHLNLQSTIDVGTIVNLTLDIELAADTDLTRHIHDSAAHFNPALKVLIADDHPVNLLFLRSLLRNAGIKHIDEASNGYEAVDQYKIHLHDIILMDCQMPQMDGFAAARLIREHASALNHAPFILAVTADVTKTAMENAMNAGMNGYVSKPINKNKLFEILKQKYAVAEDNEPPVFFSPAFGDPSQIHDNDLFELAIINHTVLRDYSEGDIEIERSITKIFSDNLCLDKEALQNALDAQNYCAWNEAVHKIYGACAHFGAERLAALCEKAQDIPVSHKAEIHSIHAEISEHYTMLIQVLSRKMLLTAA